MTGADLPMPRFMSVRDGDSLVHTLRPKRSSGTIAQLIAAQSGEGTSSVARDLAVVAARITGIRVLVLDLDPTGALQIDAMRHELGLAVVATRSLTSAVAGALVHRLLPAGVREDVPWHLSVSDIRRVREFAVTGWVPLFPELRTGFDLVLIDSQPVERSYDGIMLAPDVDTNLLVLEAERTRLSAARDLRNRILDAGGSIGGVILNKRRAYRTGAVRSRG